MTTPINRDVQQKMSIAEVIAIASGSISFGQSLIPYIQSMFASGEVSIEEQAKVMAAYQNLRKQAGGEFQGPEWELSGR